MNEYKLLEKYLARNNNNNNIVKTKDSNHNLWLFSIVNKTLISIFLFMLCLCGIKYSSNFKQLIKENVYGNNISFSTINSFYKKLFNSSSDIIDINLSNNDKNIDMVFDEKIQYIKKEEYKDGIKLIVSNNYLVPVQNSGIVVFVGAKDGYGNTFIIQQIDGVDMWYVGLENSNIKLYDYVEKGSILGEVNNNELVLFYQKDGKFIDYKEFF